MNYIIFILYTFFRFFLFKNPPHLDRLARVLERRPWVAAAQTELGPGDVQLRPVRPDGERPLQEAAGERSQNLEKKN